MHKNSELLFTKYALPFFTSGMKVLEIGPDQCPSWYQRRVAAALSVEWHTLDLYDSAQLTYANSAENSFAIPDGSYDLVLSGQVLEHVRKPWIWLPELARVTTTGGLVVTINPVSWVYHEAPIDCWRVYPEGMKALYEEAALTVLLSVWESLETPGFRRYLPGISWADQGWKRNLYYSIFGRLLGIPVERSYDTITIGRKDR